MALITRQELEDASTDAYSLERIVNGSATENGTGIVTTRLGAQLKTLAKILSELSAADISGTLAQQLQASVTAINTTVATLQTNSATKTELASTNTAVAALDSAKISDPQARSIFNQMSPLFDGPAVSAINWLFGIKDGSGKFLGVCDNTGRLYQLSGSAFEKVLSQAEIAASYFDKASGEAVKASSPAQVPQLVSGEWLFGIADATGKLLPVIDSMGRIYQLTSTGLEKIQTLDELKNNFVFRSDNTNYKSVVATYCGRSLTFRKPEATNICYILPTMGQSNAVGRNYWANDPVVSSTPVYPSNALMFTSANNFPVMTGTNKDFSITTTQPLRENWYNTAGETAASGWANHLIRDINAIFGEMITTLSFVSAQAGLPYKDLMRGSLAYERFLQCIKDAVTICKANGWVPIVPAVDWMQGEADTNLLTGIDEYMHGMQQLQRNISDDVKAITFQSETPVLLINQISYTLADGADKWDQYTRRAHLACDKNPHIRTAGPIYAYPTTKLADGVTNDTIHLNGVGQYRRGQQLARATVMEVFSSGWTPIKPITARFTSATTIQINFECLFKPLVIDTSGAVITTTGLGNGYGFWFDDASASPPTILSVTIQSQQKVIITLSVAPTGPNPKIGYATRRTPDAGVQDGPIVGPRGCLRDSCSHVSISDSSTQYNWAPSFILDL